MFCACHYLQKTKNEEKGSLKLLIILLAILALLVGCATEYQPAGVGGGYSETIYSPDVFRVHFDGNEHTPVERSRDFALLRAAELTLQHGYKYFVVINQTTQVANAAPPINSGPNDQVNNYNYGNTYNNTTGMQWNNDNASASQHAGSGVANLANFLAAQQQLRQLAQTEYLVRCFKVKPPGINVLDARLAVASLRKQYGIQTSELAATQTPTSQTDPMSGSYLGSGTSIINGIEHPYQIALEIYDSGRIDFCMHSFCEQPDSIGHRKWNCGFRR